MTERHDPPVSGAKDQEHTSRSDEPAQARLHAALARAAGLAAEMGRRLEEVAASVPEQFRPPNGTHARTTPPRHRERQPLTLAEAASLTGRHPELLRRWCAAGRIPARRVGATWVIDRDDVHLIRQIESRARPERGDVNGRHGSRSA